MSVCICECGQYIDSDIDTDCFVKFVDVAEPVAICARCRQKREDLAVALGWPPSVDPEAPSDN